MARRLMNWEARKQPLASRIRFLQRRGTSVLVALLLIGVSLYVGMLGYAHLEGMSWLDAFLNAAMILSGMGPVEPLKTASGKLFAGCYAIYSGLVLVLTAGIVLAPIAHRILHRFHIDA